MSLDYIEYPPNTRKSLDYDDVFNKVSRKWTERARKLQTRRWQKIKEEERRPALFSSFRNRSLGVR